jgi:hypothetical protein
MMIFCNLTKHANRRVTTTKRANLWACTSIQLRCAFFWDTALCQWMTSVRRFGQHTCLISNGDRKYYRHSFGVSTLKRTSTCRPPSNKEQAILQCDFIFQLKHYESFNSLPTCLTVKTIDKSSLHARKLTLNPGSGWTEKTVTELMMCTAQRSCSAYDVPTVVRFLPGLKFQRRAHPPSWSSYYNLFFILHSGPG